MLRQTHLKVFICLSQVSVQISAQLSSEIMLLLGSAGFGISHVVSVKFKDQPSANQNTDTSTMV